MVCAESFDETFRQPLFLPCGDDLCLSCLCAFLGGMPLKKIVVPKEPQDQMVINCPHCNLGFVIQQKFVD
jgi:hypothetical protein